MHGTMNVKSAISFLFLTVRTTEAKIPSLWYTYGAQA